MRILKSRRNGSAMLLLAVMGACTVQRADTGEADAAKDPPETSPRQLVEAWVAMWNNYDLDQVRRLFLEDDRLTYFSSEFQGLIRGSDAVVEHHRGFGFAPGGSSRDARLWVEDLTVDRFGDTAVMTAIWFFQGGAPHSPPQRGPVTFVSILAGGEWRFVHMNFGNYPEAEESGESG